MKIEGRHGARSTSLKRIFLAPAVQALLLQFVSLFLLLLIAFVLEAMFQLSISVLIAVLAQGVIAAALSFWRKLASWWVVIQLFFPLALLFALSLHLPPFLFLVVFLALLFVYWSTFRTQVPFYPSRLATWQAVERQLPRDAELHFIDIGSGFGGLTLHLARQRPDGHFTGIEIAPLLWLISSLRAYAARVQARFVRGDYQLLDFVDYDVIFAYLSPAAMPDLWVKARAEMRPGSLLMSYEFAIPGVTAHEIISPKAGGAKLHVWRI